MPTIRFAFPITISIPHSFNNDLGATLYYNYSTSKLQLSAGALASLGWMNRHHYINKDGKESFMFAWDKLHSANFTAFIEADYALNKQLHVVLDVHGVHNIRNSKDVFSDQLFAHGIAICRENIVISIQKTVH